MKIKPTYLELEKENETLRQKLEIKDGEEKFKRFFENNKNKAVKISEKRFKQLSDLTFESILIHNNGITIDVNRSFTEMFGYTREELLGKNVIKFLVPQKYHKAISENNL